jgi:ferrous iron transport protein A
LVPFDSLFLFLIFGGRNTFFVVFNESRFDVPCLPMEKQLLHQSQDGIPLKVTAVADDRIGAKMTEMGIVEGKIMRILYRAPFGCPIAVDMGGYILSLRKQEAQLIHVSPIQI